MSYLLFLEAIMKFYWFGFVFFISLQETFNSYPQEQAIRGKSVFLHVID